MRLPGRESDAEVICSFMEPRPVERPSPSPYAVHPVWWRWGWRYVGPSLPQQQTPVEYGWQPRILTFEALWEVQDRLTEEQWKQYTAMMMDPAGVRHTKFLLHATPEQKIRALAAVLRGEGSSGI